MLGHGAWIADDPRIAAALHARGWTQDHEELDGRWRRGEDVLSIVDEARQWTVLVQLDTVDGFRAWGSGGFLFVLIHESDLKAQRLDRVFGVVQCS